MALLAAVIIAAWSLLPIYWIVNLSLQTSVSVHSSPAPLFPFQPNLQGYVELIRGVSAPPTAGYNQASLFRDGLVDSLVVATAVMALSLLLSIPSAYGLARFHFPFRTPFFLLVIFVRSLPPVSTLFSLYNFYKVTSLAGTFPGIILAHLTLTTPLIVWVTVGIFAAIPREMDKQARVDGCSRARMLRSVILPIAAPGIAVTAVLSWLTSWNEYIFALFLADSKGLRLVGPLVAPGGGSPYLVVSMIPPLVGAIFMARYMERLSIVGPPPAMAEYLVGGRQ